MTDLNSRTSRVQSPHGNRRRSTDPVAVAPIRTGCLVPVRAGIDSLPGTGLQLPGDPLDGVSAQQGWHSSPWPPSSLRSTSCTHRAREATTPPVRATEGMVP